MPPTRSNQAGSQSSQQKRKANSKPTRRKTVRLGASAPVDEPKRVDPLKAFSQFASSSSSSASTPCSASDSSSQMFPPVFTIPSRKGKEKATDRLDHSLWVDKYEPQEEGELAVHVKKVEDVKRWLDEAFEGGPSGRLTKYRRILVLTGPAGTGKTTTLRMLARSMGFDILEWKNSIESPAQNDGVWSSRDSPEWTPDYDYENNFTKFEAFLSRASSCHTIFNDPAERQSKRLILLEDLPNILHLQIQTQFHSALKSFVDSNPSNPPTPLAIVISDAGLRGEARDERLAEGRGWGKDKDQTLDIRTVLPHDLLGGPYVTEIGFNPIAPTLLKKALQAMLNKHSASVRSNPGATSNVLMPSKEVLDMIVASANGDIRSAIMALQFACVVQVPNPKKRLKGQNADPNTVFVMESVTRREQSLALFHMLGKVLYNKRKGDPAAASATARDIQRDIDLDASLPDTMRLPDHLQHHERRASRVDVNNLYSDSPIDSSLFSLYVHQNYIPFCEETEEVEGISDWLSYVDSSGGDAWYQSNPHQFHLLAMGILHSLPTPVPRRSQKYFKPEFFHYHQTQCRSLDAVRTVKSWLTDVGTEAASSGWRAGGWSNENVAMELGGVLKARDSSTASSNHLSTLSQSSIQSAAYFKPPPAHRTFSRMQFVWGHTGSQSAQLNENDGADVADQRNMDEEEEGNNNNPWGRQSGDQSLNDRRSTHAGWLSDDDIEEFD